MRAKNAILDVWVGANTKAKMANDDDFWLGDSLLNDDESQDDDISFVQVTAKSGDALRSDDTVVAANPIERGPDGAKLRLVGLTSTAPNPMAVSTAERRTRLEELRNVRRRDVVALQDLRPSTIRSRPEAIERELEHVRSRHTDLSVGLPPSIASQRDSAFRNYLLSRLDVIRGLAEKEIRDELATRDENVLRARARTQLRRESDQDNDDENEEEFSPSSSDIDTRAAALKETERVKLVALARTNIAAELDIDPATVSDARIQDRLDSRYDDIAEERVNTHLGSVLAEFERALPNQWFGRLPFVRNEINEYFEKALDKRYARAVAVAAGDALPFGSDNDDNDESAFYELITKTYTLSAMANAWFEAWATKRGIALDNAPLVEVRRDIVELITGIRAEKTSKHAILPTVQINDRQVQELTTLGEEFSRAVYMLADRNGGGEAAVRHLEKALSRTSARGAHFASVETAQAATALFRAVNELSGFEATLERDIVKLSAELETIAERIEVPLVIERFVNDTQHAPVTFEVRVEGTSPAYDVLANETAFTFEWHRVGTDGVDRIVRTVPINAKARGDHLEVAVSLAAGGVYYAVARSAVPSPLHTTLVSARATLRIVARCLRDGVIHELAPSPSAHFGECRWRTRAVNAKRKHKDDTPLGVLGIVAPPPSQRDQLDDASLLRLTVLGRKGVRDQMFTFDAMLRVIEARLDDDVVLLRSSSVLEILVELRSGELREKVTPHEARFIDTLYERLVAFALIDADQRETRPEINVERALAKIASFNEAKITTHATVWSSRRVRSGDASIERATFFIDTDGEREFWRDAELALKRQRTAATLRCEAQRLPVEAPFVASLRGDAEPLCQEADWYGIHSYTSDQPEVYSVQFDDEAGSALVRRGSARVFSGYDFDALHEMIMSEITRYVGIASNEIGWRGARMLSRKRAQHAIYAYNVLAVHAPNRGENEPVVSAEEIMHRFSKISYRYSTIE